MVERLTPRLETIGKNGRCWFLWFFWELQGLSRQGLDLGRWLGGQVFIFGWWGGLQSPKIRRFCDGCKVCMMKVGERVWYGRKKGTEGLFLKLNSISNKWDLNWQKTKMPLMYILIITFKLQLKIGHSASPQTRIDELYTAVSNSKEKVVHIKNSTLRLTYGQLG